MTQVFGSGSEVTMYYDPLISKLVCWGSNRATTIKLMKRALSEYQIAGVINNIPFLSIIIDHNSFKSGKFDINFLNDKFMDTLRSLENANGKEELEKIVAIFSALLKYKSKTKTIHTNSSEVNKWREQLYE